MRSAGCGVRLRFEGRAAPRTPHVLQLFHPAQSYEKPGPVQPPGEINLDRKMEEVGQGEAEFVVELVGYIGGVGERGAYLI